MLALLFILFLCFDLFYKFFLITEHNVPGKSNCFRKVFGHVMMSYEGWVAFCRLMNRLQSFGTPLLDCEVHLCFCLLCPLPGGSGWLPVAEVEYFLLLGSLRL